MKIPNLLLLLSAFVMLTACASAPNEIPEIPPTDKPVVLDEAISSYPEPEEPVVRPTDSEVVYPAPNSDGGVVYPAPEEPVQQTSPDLGGAPENQDYAPRPEDEGWTRGKVFIDSNEILLLESYPVQVHMIIAGNLPTPCNELRLIVSPPDDNNRIEIEAYSVTEPNLMCTQVLEPFEARISLGNFTEGEFTVWIEGEQVGEFSLP
jgi:hypothetical protein